MAGACQRWGSSSHGSKCFRFVWGQGLSDASLEAFKHEATHEYCLGLTVANGRGLSEVGFKPAGAGLV